MLKIKYATTIKNQDVEFGGSSVGYEPLSGTIVEEMRGRESNRGAHGRASHARIRRRFNGILLELCGENVRVGFSVKGKLVEYIFPKGHLSHAGVKRINQPFEMDEIAGNADGGYMMGYIFRPLAETEDAFRDTVQLSPEREAKLKLIYEKFKDVAP